MTATNIEWCDAVWNPVTGCTKVSAGCKNCYAEGVALRFWGDRKFGDVQCHETRLDQPLHWRRPRRIFVNSMSDLFHEDVPGDFIYRVLRIIEKCPQHQFLVLTKRAQAMRDFFWGESGAGASVDPLRNLWLGVSCEDQVTADERIPLLLQTPAAVRFVSLEPLLGLTTLRRWIYETDDQGACHCCGHQVRCRFEPGWSHIDWVIVGGESGPGARPCRQDWIRGIIDQCENALVPVFVKQLGSRSYTGPVRPFNSFCQWVNKAQSWIGGTGAICFDALGRECVIGEHFMRADAEGQFPVTCHLPMSFKDRKGGNIEEWPEWAQIRQWLEVQQCPS